MPPAPPFPLPFGHQFGPTGFGSAQMHDGRDFRDAIAIKAWGGAYKGRMRRPRFEVGDGLYAGHYQRAVAELQKVAHLPVTGLLGWEEWPLPWTLDRPEGTYVRPGGDHVEEFKAAHRKNVREYWRKYSKYDVHPGSDPTAPAWFPGRPFGQREYGDHVKPVQGYFGLKANGRFDRTLAQRIRGFQRSHDLPVSGLVDARTASYIQAEIDDLNMDPPPEGGGS